jgi:hypothetical protein
LLDVKLSAVNAYNGEGQYGGARRLCTSGEKREKEEVESSGDGVEKSVALGLVSAS